MLALRNSIQAQQVPSTLTTQSLQIKDICGKAFWNVIFPKSNWSNFVTSLSDLDFEYFTLEYEVYFSAFSYQQFSA